MIQMTRHFAANAGPNNIRVNAVLPGFIVQDEHRHRFEQMTINAIAKLRNFPIPCAYRRIRRYSECMPVPMLARRILY